MNYKEIETLAMAIANIDYLINEGVHFTPSEISRLQKLVEGLARLTATLQEIPTDDYLEYLRTEVEILVNNNSEIL